MVRAALKLRSDMADRPGSAIVADRELVARIAAGGETALGVLYDRYARTEYALAFAITGERSDAEGATSQPHTIGWACCRCRPSGDDVP